MECWEEKPKPNMPATRSRSKYVHTTDQLMRGPGVIRPARREGDEGLGAVFPHSRWAAGTLLSPTPSNIYIQSALSSAHRRSPRRAGTRPRAAGGARTAALWGYTLDEVQWDLPGHQTGRTLAGERRSRFCRDLVDLPVPQAMTSSPFGGGAEYNTDLDRAARSLRFVRLGSCAAKKVPRLTSALKHN